MLEKIKGILKLYTEVDEEQMTGETELQSDLDLNSLDVMNIVVDFEDAFNIEIPDEDVNDFLKVSDIEDYLKARIVE